VAHRLLRRCGAESADLSSESLAGFEQEGAREREDVVPALSRRGDADLDHPQPVVEVLAEARGMDLAAFAAHKDEVTAGYKAK